MAIMGQILGQSFGRQPMQMAPIMRQNIGQMSPMNIPQMYDAPQRAQVYGTPTSAQGNPGMPGPQGQGVPGRMIASWQHPGGGPHMTPGGGNPGIVPPGNSAGGANGAGGGIMGQIMNAFNGGYGGGMDMTKLLSMVGAA